MKKFFLGLSFVLFFLSMDACTSYDDSFEASYDCHENPNLPICQENSPSDDDTSNEGL